MWELLRTTKSAYDTTPEIVKCIAKKIHSSSSNIYLKEECRFLSLVYRCLICWHRQHLRCGCGLSFRASARLLCDISRWVSVHWHIWRALLAVIWAGGRGVKFPKRHRRLAIISTTGVGHATLRSDLPEWLGATVHHALIVVERLEKLN